MRINRSITREGVVGVLVVGGIVALFRAWQPAPSRFHVDTPELLPLAVGIVCL